MILAFFVWDWTENQIDFYLSRINSGLERMAQVQSKSNNVTRNHNGQLLWQDIDIGEVVYVGNSIQTEKNSSTEIILDGGEKIMIGSESLVRFVRADDKILLQLVEGKIEIKSPDLVLQKIMRLDKNKSKRLIIKTPQGSLALNDSRLKLQAEKNNEKNFKIEVVSALSEVEGAAAEKAKPVAELAAEPVAELAAEPVAELAAEPVAELAAEPAIERQPAKALLTAPRVKSIKVKEVE